MTFRRIAAALLVLCAGLFIVGVSAEGDTHAESTEVRHDDGSVEGAADEAAHRQGAEGAEASNGHDEPDEHHEEQVLGVDVESPGTVGLAVAVSLALAVALWLRNERSLAVAAVAVGVVFAVFDIVEVAHQIDESRTSLAVLVSFIAAGHVAVAAAAGVSTQRPV